MTPTPVFAPARRSAAKKASSKASTKGPAKTLGALPEWNLADLYPRWTRLR